MNDNEPTPESVKQAMQEMRERTRSRAQRLRFTANLLVFASLLAFLGLSLLAAKASWEALQMPAYLLIPFAALALSLQRILGLTVRRGRLQSHGRYLRHWIALALASLAAIVAVGLIGYS